MALTDADAAKVADAVKDVVYNLSGDTAKSSWQAAKNGMADIRPKIDAIMAEQAAQRAWLENIAAAVGAPNPEQPV